MCFGCVCFHTTAGSVRVVRKCMGAVISVCVGQCGIVCMNAKMGFFLLVYVFVSGLKCL